MNHTFTIKNRSTMGGLVFICSCGRWKGPVFPSVGGTDEIPLDKFNEIAHKHIEAVEAEDRADSEASQAYRTTSAVTSEDQLVDLSTGSFSRLTDESRGGDFTYEG